MRGRQAGMAHIERQDCHAWRTAQVDRRRTHTLSRPRDLVQCVQALLALGAEHEARNTLRYLVATPGSRPVVANGRGAERSAYLTCWDNCAYSGGSWRIECTSNGAIELDVTKGLLDHNCAWPQRLYRRSLTTDEQVRDPPVA